MGGSFGVSAFFVILYPKSKNYMQNPLILKPAMEDSGRLQPFVAEAAEAAGISEKEALRLRLAVEEAVANVINYGEATNITLSMSVDEERLVLTLVDDGVPFDPTQGSQTDLSVPPDERPPGGMGIILMHQMTDGLSYQRAGGHNVLTIKKLRNQII